MTDWIEPGLLLNEIGMFFSKQGLLINTTKFSCGWRRMRGEQGVRKGRDLPALPSRSTYWAPWSCGQSVDGCIFSSQAVVGTLVCFTAAF